jgi:hypothetical protein
MNLGKKFLYLFLSCVSCFLDTSIMGYFGKFVKHFLKDFWACRKIDPGGARPEGEQFT